MNLNESPIGPSPLSIAAAQAAISGVNRYPPTDGGSLVAALAAHTGIPADRIGVSVGSDMMLHLLCMVSLAPGRSAVRPIFEMTTPSLVAAEAALSDRAHLRTMLDLVAKGRAQLVAGLQALRFSPLPSAANFITTDLRRTAGPVLRAMAEQGVLVRGVGDPCYENFLRITMGLPDENGRALKALQTASGIN